MTEQRRPTQREAADELPYIDDRVSKLWVLLIVVVFAGIFLYGVLLGRAGLLAPSPTESPVPGLSPSPGASPLGSPSPSPVGSPGASPSPAGSPIPPASPAPIVSPTPSPAES